MTLLWVALLATQPSLYRAELTIEGGVVAFHLALTAQRATIHNGEERLEAPVRSEGPSLLIDFPHYDGHIEATRHADGHLSGTWSRTRKRGVARLPFRATPVATLEDRYPAGPEASKVQAPPLASVWRMNFAESGLAKGTCRSTDGAVQCTVRTPTGDYRYLAGNLHGQRLRLSTFDGAHAFLFDARLASDGSMLRGDFYSGAHWHETFTASPAEQVTLPDGFQATRATVARFNHPALDDPRLRGKAVIVEVFGTWCPNCHDAAALLAELQRRYEGQGLALLGLAFEYTEDAVRSRRQVTRFSQRHGLDWKVVVAGVSDKGAASRALPQLDRVRAFPTTLFLDRDRTIRGIHTGFDGPATGATHARIRAEFERLTRAILASRP